MKNIAEQFKICAPVASVQPYGAGHINETYLVVCTDGTRYILQKINHNIFPDVENLMKNICGVTNYIAKANENVEGAETLEVIFTLEGKPYCCVDGNYYRMYNFLSGQTVETGATLKQFQLAGKAFGNFQKLLDGYPADKLFETIKDFHNTEKRFEAFEKAVSADVCGRVAECADEIAFYRSRKHYCGKVLQLIENGQIPLRVTHNDTKPNNVLVDEQRNLVVGVIDLDTIMPGSVLYDFGDSIRYGANTAAEDETDLSKVQFSKQYYEAYCSGFLPEAKDMLSPSEKENIHFGAILMTYECGMRFLTDYLSGDTYFRIHREKHNLERCHTQIKLVEEMERNLDAMVQIAQKYMQ